MIKRIIFDLDNTLIVWKNEYKNALKETIKIYLDISNKELEKVVDEYDNLIESYEKYYDKYTINNMLELLQNKINPNLDKSFVEFWLNKLCEMSESNNDTIETLEYLSKKYELVVLTNWFDYSQIERLKKAKIYKYFKEFYGGEQYIKPNPMSYKTAMSNRNINECIMIGDNLKIDIEGAINIGMKAILVDNNNIHRDSDKYIRIKNIKELKEIL